MSTARYLALIDLLRTREFPAQRRRTETGFSGPGYHTVELSAAEEPAGEDAADRVEARERCVAEHDALVAVLDGRWGEAQVFGLWSLLERSIGGEAVPAPWDELSAGFDSLHLWRADGRWIAVGLALEAEGPSYALAAVVTGIDPP
ncbi:hypothetical protein [Streptomyces albidochromogenes]|uniref:Uncharacterized protein n=1 Tax=Streptomyces albidochromogenes TaxID=329524 RepID=A0ABW6FV57_9ACTN